jgi:hypothetical protein
MVGYSLLTLDLGQDGHGSSEKEARGKGLYINIASCIGRCCAGSRHSFFSYSQHTHFVPLHDGMINRHGGGIHTVR